MPTLSMVHAHCLLVATRCLAIARKVNGYYVTPVANDYLDSAQGISKMQETIEWGHSIQYRSAWLAPI